MDTNVPLPSYVTKRNGVFYFVRRIPDDLIGAFGRRTRIQRSLRTSAKPTARSRAALVNDEVERHLAEARAKLGVAVELGDVSDWTADDWRKVAAWFEARLIQDDLERRLPRLKGAWLTGASGSQSDYWSEDALLREKISLKGRLEEMTVSDYARERMSSVNEVVRRIGVSLLDTSPHAMPFSAMCLKAELNAIEIFFRRDRGEQVDWPHPDTIEGRWKRQGTRRNGEVQPSFAAPEIVSLTPKSGKTLADCQARWKEDRETAKKRVREAHMREMSGAVELFEQTQGVRDIADIRRRHLVAFRSHLETSGKFKIATVNKKTSMITTLLATAERHAWIENAVRGNIFLEVPEGDDDKDPFSTDELAYIFGYRTFTSEALDTRVKAGRELQFWLPVISCLHGLISSEIIQLGPDSIVCYPGTDILCFNVTTAGGRHTKVLSRKRFVPIRRELLNDGGLLALVERAKLSGWRSLWSAVEDKDGDGDRVASMFSSFWSDFLRHDLGIKDAKKSLYSLRHSFKDSLRGIGAEDHIQNALMGHAEPGTGRRYGTKRKPPPVPISMLNETVHRLEWSFLAGLKFPTL